MMFMLDKVREKRETIRELARRHNAERLWVFGSCARRRAAAPASTPKNLMSFL